MENTQSMHKEKALLEIAYPISKELKDYAYFHYNNKGEYMVQAKKNTAKI